jgi:transcriptional activator SPT7
MVLHALYENGQLGPADIESHIKDDIEKEELRVAEMARKMRQAYKEVVSVPLPSACLSGWC